MIRLLISVALVFAVATSAEAMSPAPLHANSRRPTVRPSQSSTNMALSTMRGKWHLHVAHPSSCPPSRLPQVCGMERRCVC